MNTEETTMKEVEVKDVKNARYIETIGRRKTSIARVRMTPASKASYSVNEKTLEEYFVTKELQSIVLSALSEAKISAKFKITALIRGGGIHSQSEALRHGISRGLIEYDKELRTRLKVLGFLTRDPRAKERRKFGLKKARKSPQWSKR